MKWGQSQTHIIGVVLLQDPAAALVDLLVARAGATHCQRRVHVHVVTGQIEADQPLEDDRPARERRRQEDQQARCCAPICHHVEYGAELGRLVEAAGGVAVEGVEDAGYGVEEAAGSRVERHVVEG